MSSKNAVNIKSTLTKTNNKIKYNNREYTVYLTSRNNKVIVVKNKKIYLNKLSGGGESTTSGSERKKDENGRKYTLYWTDGPDGYKSWIVYDKAPVQNDNYGGPPY